MPKISVVVENLSAYKTDASRFVPCGLRPPDVRGRSPAGLLPFEQFPAFHAGCSMEHQ